jgi:beta-lactamase class A
MGDATRGDVVGNPASHALMRSASIVKVLIGMALFARAEREGRGLNIDEQSDLRNMIRVSDNNAATRLWASLGGPAVISWVRGVTGIQETQPPAIGGQWGFTLTDAHDMAVILTSLAQARGINANDRNALLSEMRQVTPGQRWGISPAVLRSTPAVKNGWFPDTDEPVWRVHCTGVVDEGGRPNRWGIAVMTRYPIGLGMIYGEDTCQRVANLALAGDS